MIETRLIEILACPGCGSTGLKPDAGSQGLTCPGCGQHFVYNEGVVILFPGQSAHLPEASEVHKTFGSAFDYWRHYEEDALEFDYFEERSGATGYSETRVKEVINSQVKGTKGAILDVGCGSAWVAAKFCPKGFEVVSLDISLKNTSEALKKYPYPNHFAVAADAFSLPFPPHTFDYVIASEIIEHVASPGAFVKSLFRVVKPGGSLIVTTPYKEKIHYSLCVHCNKPTPHHAHLHSFDEFKLEKLCREDDLREFSFVRFGNKVLIYLRTHVLLKYFSFAAWRVIDKAFNFLYHAPSTILARWEKK